LQSGLQKLNNWTAADFLSNAVAEANPFHGFFTSLAGNPVVDFLNIWGAILIGLVLMLGLAVRWSAFWGTVMMLLYWAAALQGGLGDFLPLENGWVVDEHIVYIGLLFGLSAIGAGRMMGLDAWLERQEFVQNNPWLLYLLG
jgi:thiosulfate dehydrogenase [quinone] large subunit